MAEQVFTSNNLRDIELKEAGLCGKHCRLVRKWPGEKPGAREYTKTTASGSEWSVGGPQLVMLTRFE